MGLGKKPKQELTAMRLLAGHPHKAPLEKGLLFKM